MQLTLHQLFGEGSYQDEVKVVVNKASLPLTTSSDNTSQSLFAALLERARYNYHGQLSGNNELLTVDSQPFEFDNSILYDDLNVFYSRNQVTGEIYQSIYKVVIRYRD